MAHILRGYGVARENYYFKEVQEAEVHEYQKYVSKSNPNPSKNYLLSQLNAEATYEVLPEIMRNEFRLRADDAKVTRNAQRRTIARPPALIALDRHRQLPHQPQRYTNLPLPRYTNASAHRVPAPYMHADNLHVVHPATVEYGTRSAAIMSRVMLYGTSLMFMGFIVAGGVALASFDMTMSRLAQRERERRGQEGVVQGQAG